MTVVDGAPKHVEWADRMAQALQVAGSDLGTIDYLTRQHPDSYKRQTLDEAMGRLRNSLSSLDKVHNEIANSENLEEELHDLIEAVGNDPGVKTFLVHQAQSAQRVLDRIVHVGDPSGG